MAIKLAGNTVIDDASRACFYANTTIITNCVSIGFARTPSPMQGTTSGYVTGRATVGDVNAIDKFPFASTSFTASEIGDLSIYREAAAVASSQEHGYTLGGYSAPSTPNTLDVVDKFPFASDTNATCVGTLGGYGTQRSAGASSTTCGYNAGGYGSPSTPANTQRITKIPFAADTNAVLYSPSLAPALNTVNMIRSGSQSSTENGYFTGGYSTMACQVRKMSFANETALTCIGALSTSGGVYGAVGNSSRECGYASGGQDPGAAVRTIDRFPFANETGVVAKAGELSNLLKEGAGSNSDTAGYISGGEQPAVSPPAICNTVEKFDFASDVSSSCVGSLTVAGYRGGEGGLQD